MRLIELGDARWLEFVESRADATIFHHPAWARLLADCYGYPAMVAAVTDGGGAVRAGLPLLDVSLPFGGRRWVSLPFTDHCPLLAEGDTNEVVAGLRELAGSAKVHQLEVRAPLAAALSPPGDAGFVRHDLALSGDTRRTWRELRRNHRRNVVDAEEAGVRVAWGRTATDVETFYRIHLQTRRRLGVPIQPRRFFRLFWERLIDPGLAFVLTAYRGEDAAAAAVFCAWNGTLICKYSGRADGFEKLDGIHLLFWNAIRWASENGYHAFDLGRSGREQVQLRSFKAGWGAEERPLPYSHIAGAPVRSSSGRLQSAMAVAIRNSAPWLCRAVGELFYRYAA